MTPCSAYRRTVVIVGLLVPLLTAPGAAQAPYPRFEISGRLQQHFYWFDNEAYAAEVGPASTFFTRRARIQAYAQITDRISLVIQPSYEGGRTLEAETVCEPLEVPDGGGTLVPECTTSGKSGFRLRDAFVDLRLSPPKSATGLTLRVGQEKRPFSRYELLSSNNLPSIERNAGAGLVPVASNNLFESSGYLSTDIGAALMLSAELGDRPIAVHAGVYNGQGESLHDVNAAKSYGARATFGVLPKLSVGAAAFRHDYVLVTDESVDSAAYNGAWEVDAQWGAPGRPGLFALAEYLRGGRMGAPGTTMAGLQVLAAWHQPTGGDWVQAVEPGLRLDVADRDLDGTGDRATLFTAVVGLYFSSRAQLRLAYESQTFQADLEPVRGLRSALTVNF